MPDSGLLDAAQTMKIKRKILHGDEREVRALEGGFSTCQKIQSKSLGAGREDISVDTLARGSDIAGIGAGLRGLGKAGTRLRRDEKEVQGIIGMGLKGSRCIGPLWVLCTRSSELRERVERCVLVESLTSVVNLAR